MKTAITIVDDFHPDPEGLRRAVLAGGFFPHMALDGAVYPHVSGYDDNRLVGLVEDFVGKGIAPRIMGWRLDLNGDLPWTAVHSDENCGAMAGVLYLSHPDNCQGGTAFWKHKTLHRDAMPSSDEASASNHEKAIALALHQDWKDAGRWEQSAFAGMKFNRFVTYPTSLFHSRFPREGFGTGPENGRLVWCVFFDVKEGA